MKRLLLLCAVAAALAFPARAQFVSDFQQVTTDTTGGLRGPVTFFTANSNRIFAIIGTSNLIADLAAKAGLTNGLLVTPTLTNATLKGITTVPAGQVVSLPSGAALIGSPGSIVVVDQITVSGNPTNTTALQGATRGYVDFQRTALVDDLTGLLNTEVSTYLNRFAYVRSNTSGDGAAGLWIWDPTSTWTESTVIKKSPLLDPSSAGRWLHL